MVNLVLLKSTENLRLIKDEEMPAYALGAGKLFYLKNKDNDPLAIELGQEQYNELVGQLKVQTPLESLANERSKANRLDQKKLAIISALTKHTASLVHQGVIRAIADYLKWNGIELKPNSNGICNGLAAVYCKYVLEDREDEFFDMLQRIVDKRFTGDYSQEEKVNSFIREVLLTFLPSEFDKTQSQNRAIEMLKVANPNNANESANLQNAFQFSATTTAEHWAEILDKMQIEGIAFNLGNEKHAMGMKFKEGKFRLYTTYSAEIKTFATASALTAELFKSFKVKPDEAGISRLPMNIELVKHPYKSLSDESLQKLSSLNKKDLIEEAFHKDGFSIEGTFEMAIKDNDEELVKIILAKDENIAPKFEQMITAVKENSLKVLPLLLERANLVNLEYFFVIKCALLEGRESAFDLLINSPKNPFDMTKLALTVEQKRELLENAAESGNHKCVSKALGLCSEEEVNAVISEVAISNAIKAGKVAPFELLLNKKPVLEEKVTQFLHAAIDANQSQMVAHLLHQYPASKEAVPSITITSEFVDNTNIKILLLLKDAGAQLEDGIEEKIKEKQQFQSLFRENKLNLPETLPLWEAFIQLLKSFSNFVKSTLFLGSANSKPEMQPLLGNDVSDSAPKL